MHPQPLAAGTGGARLVSVDAGRIALQRRDGTLVVLSAAGRRVGGFRLGAQGVEAVRLTGSRIVVLRRATIEVRDALRGATIRRWPVGRGIAPLGLEDAHGNFAVYVEGIALHVLRLSDGRDHVLALADQAGPTHAELEPEGLYYSYNATGSSKPGRVAFVPFAELAARFDEAAVRPQLVKR